MEHFFIVESEEEKYSILVSYFDQNFALILNNSKMHVFRISFNWTSIIRFWAE